MNAAEIEEWFTREKHRLERGFRQEFEQHLTDTTIVKRKYDAKLRKLIGTYQEKHLSLLKRERRIRMLHRPLERCAERLSETGQQLRHTGERWWLTVKKRVSDLLFRWSVLRR